MCPDAVSLTWLFGYMEAGSSFNSRSKSALPPPSSTLALLVPLAFSFTDGVFKKDFLGYASLGSSNPFSFLIPLCTILLLFLSSKVIYFTPKASFILLVKSSILLMFKPLIRPSTLPILPSSLSKRALAFLSPKILAASPRPLV